MAACLVQRTLCRGRIRRDERVAKQRAFRVGAIQIAIVAVPKACVAEAWVQEGYDRG